MWTFLYLKLNLDIMYIFYQVGHPALQEVTLRHIPRPAKKQKHKYNKLLHFAMHFAMDQYHTAPGCSR